MRHCWSVWGLLPLGCLLGGLLLPATARAQLAEEDSQELIGRLQEVQFAIVSGRIVAYSNQTGTTSHDLVDQATGRREQIRIDGTSGIPSVRYQLSDPKEELTIDLADGDQLTIRRTTKDRALHGVEFTQPKRGELTLTIGEGEQRRVFHGASLWHLALAEPDVCRTDLFPLLEVMSTRWHLKPMLAAIEESLDHGSSPRRLADRRLWSTWVAGLGSPSFAARQAAQQKLENAGPAVVPFLENLDQRHLDAEQRSRIRELAADLDDTSEDRAERVIAWLAADPDIWLSQLSR